MHTLSSKIPLTTHSPGHILDSTTTQQYMLSFLFIFATRTNRVLRRSRKHVALISRPQFYFHTQSEKHAEQVNNAQQTTQSSTTYRAHKLTHKATQCQHKRTNEANPPNQRQWQISCLRRFAHFICMDISHLRKATRCGTSSVRLRPRAPNTSTATTAHSFNYAWLFCDHSKTHTQKHKHTPATLS